MRFSLRTKILLLIAGTVTGLATLLLLALTALAHREVGRAVRQDVRVTGGVLAQFVRERSAALQNQSLLLARQPVLKASIGTGDPATVTDCIRDYLKQIGADAASATDQSGRLLAETDAPGSGPSVSAAGRSLDSGVEAALRGETWAGVVAHNERLMLAVSVPVLEPVSRYVKGTFTAYSAIDAKVASELKRALGSEVAFVAQGQVRGASLPLPARLPLSQGAVTLLTAGGARYFALYAPLPGTRPEAGLGYVVLRPYGTAMAMYSRFQAAFATVSALALLLALAAGAVVARGITGPLDGVVQAARTLREGQWPERFEGQRSDEIGLLQSVFNEMTEAMRASQERLLALIDTDALTGLDNHRRFQERLLQETKRSLTSGEPLSLLFFDLDHFHEFNQQRGHAEGDAALQKLALLLQNSLPEVAILARFGGEEFVALLPRCEIGQAETFAEKIRALAAKTWCAAEDTPALTLSIGCAEFGTHTTQAEGLILAAELAVSRAKQLGRNRVCRFDSVAGADANADPYQLHKFLKDGSLATIQALAAAVDAKDPYTQGHSQRVAAYAADLARAIGMPQDEVDLIYTTGTLHDVGKIGIPDSILKKPGPLDAEERAIMQTHPALGEVIVRKAPQLAATLPGVLHHHEAWDGRGYPNGLQGEAIPLLARVLAVADTFDAMTSDRPYRKGLSLEVALGEIEKGAGRQFDPRLAPAFVTMMQARMTLPRAA